MPLVPATAHVLGAADAPVTLVEFGDLECPYCRDAAPVLRDAVDRSGGAVRLVFRHFPLFEVHPHALVAALAAEAAGEQGAFWPMHDLLFAHQDRLDEASLAAYGTALGLAGPVAGDAVQHLAERVRRDYADGIAAGVTATPTVFVNGRRLGRVTPEALSAAVDEAATAALP